MIGRGPETFVLPNRECSLPLRDGMNVVFFGLKEGLMNVNALLMFVCLLIRIMFESVFLVGFYAFRAVVGFMLE